MDTSPDDKDYFTVTTINDLPTTGVKYYTFNGIFQFVKFCWDNSTDNTGIIDKILYRQ